jgi:hypothetical protein
MNRMMRFVIAAALLALLMVARPAQASTEDAFWGASISGGNVTVDGFGFAGNNTYHVTVCGYKNGNTSQPFCSGEYVGVVYNSTLGWSMNRTIPLGCGYSSGFAAIDDYTTGAHVYAVYPGTFEPTFGASGC